MRFSGFFIDGFGLFHDILLRDLPRGLVFFRGNNEAGKTTCLAFLRSMLFGIPSEQSKENSYPPLAGGQHGGRVMVVSDRMGEVTVERRPGRRGGPVTVSFTDGRTGAEEDLRQLLGYTTAELFRNIYAFSLSELTTLESLDNDSVKGALYGASAGAAMQAIPKAIKMIEQQMASLFAARGRKPTINVLLGALDEVERKLREAMKGASKYNEAYGSLRDTEGAIEKARNRERELRADSDQAGTYLKLWDDWVQLQLLQRDLQNTPAIESFPEEGVRRLEHEVERLQEERKALDDRRNECEEIERKATALVVEERLLGQEQRVRALLDGRARYGAASKALPLSRQALAAKERAIGGLLASLGHEWTEQRVEQTDMSLFTREAIRRHQERLLAARSAREKAEGLLESRRSDLEKACSAEQGAQSQLDQYGSPEEEVAEATLDSLRRGRDQFAAIVQDLPLVENELATAEGDLGRTIREIDIGWSEAQVTAFDCSVPAQEAVQAIEIRLNDAKGQVKEAGAAFTVVTEQLRKARDARDSKARELERMAPSPAETRVDLTERKSQLRLLRGLLSQRDVAVPETRHSEERLSEKRGELSQPSTLDAQPLLVLPSWSPMVCAAICLLGVLMLLFPVTRLAGVVVALAGAALYLLYRRLGPRQRETADRAQAKSEGLQQAISTIEVQLNECRARQAELQRGIDRLCERLRIEGQIAIDRIDVLEAEADEALSLSDARRRVEDDIANLAKEVAEAEHAVETARDRRTQAEQDLREAEQAWAEQAGTLGLSLSVEPRTALLVFRKVDAAKTNARAVKILKSRIRSMEKARDDYLAPAKALPALAGAVGGQLPQVLSAIDVFLDQSKQNAQKRQKRELAEQDLNAKKRHREELEAVVRAAQTALGDRTEEERQAESSWQEWLGQRGLSADLSPETTFEALKIIEDCLRLIGERARLGEAVQLDEGDIRKYENLASETFEALSRPVPEADRLVSGIELLGDELSASKTNLSLRKQLEDQLPRLRAEILSTETLIAEIAEGVSKLIHSGGASDEEEFRKRGSLYTERQDLLRRVSQCEGNLTRFSGEENMATLSGELKGLAREQLVSKRDTAAQELEAIEVELTRLRDKKAEVNDRMGRLSSAEEISQLRAEEERIREEIRCAAMDWARHALAGHLLDKARERFEREQQPKVIQDASGFFRAFTGDVYERVLCPIGENTFEVVSARGDRKRPEQLSRGAAEQLYLAIRFGYILNYAPNGERLPVIMDDILVNFDPERASHAAAAILDLAGKHQVLYFTCHPQTVAIFRQHSPNFPIYQIGDGRIALAEARQ